MDLDLETLPQSPGRIVRPLFAALLFVLFALPTALAHLLLIFCFVIAVFAGRMGAWRESARVLRYGPRRDCRLQRLGHCLYQLERCDCGFYISNIIFHIFLGGA